MYSVSMYGLSSGLCDLEINNYNSGCDKLGTY